MNGSRAVAVSARFEICLTASKVALALEVQPAAAAWAQAALDLAAADRGCNHPTLGLVHLDSQTRAGLVR